MVTVWQRIEAWLTGNAPQAVVSLRPGASDAEITATEQRLGVTFPEDVRASYRIHDGQERDGYGPLPVEEFLSLARIQDEWQVWKDLLDGGDFEGIESEPSGPIRADWWNARWIPITYDGSGNHLCLDLDPAPGGQIGQIITMWHDEGTRSIVAGSFTAWLEDYADGLEAGEYVVSDAYNGIVSKDDV